MLRKVSILLLLFIFLVSPASCIDSNIWSLYSHNELMQGESFNINDYVVTLASIETNTTTGGYTLLVQYRNDKTGDIGSKYISRNEAVYFDNDTCVIDYPNEFVGKHFLNAYTLDEPKISMVALFNRRYDNDTIEVNISMKNDGMTATDITTKIVFPENYDVSETKLFDSKTLTKFGSIQGTVQLERERGMSHFELDTIYKFVNPATNKVQEESFVRTINIFENNTTLVQDCSLEDDEVYDRYFFLERYNRSVNSTNPKRSSDINKTIVATNISGSRDQSTTSTKVIVNNDEINNNESPVSPEVIPQTIPRTMPMEVPVSVDNNPNASPVVTPEEAPKEKKPMDNKIFQIIGVVVVTVFAMFMVSKSKKQSQKITQSTQPPIDITKDDKIDITKADSSQGNQINPDLLNDEEEDEKNTFSWARESD